LSRYKGESWGTFTEEDGLTSNMVRAFVEDGDGNTWFATDSGVSRYGTMVCTIGDDDCDRTIADTELLNLICL